MPYKPVGIDENGRLPPRAVAALDSRYLAIPSNPQNGQILIWNAATREWESKNSNTIRPSVIDGGSPYD